MKGLNAKGELDGLKLTDFTLSTNSAKDFDDDPRVSDDPGKGAAAFVILGYSSEIFINTRSNDYASFKGGDGDYVLYGGTAIRHEKYHRDNYPNGDTSEHGAYTKQLTILQKYGPGAFKSRENYQLFIDHVTSGTKRKD